MKAPRRWLATTSSVAICVLLLGGAFLLAGRKGPRGLTDPKLIKLVEQYKAYGLPLPTKDAKLVLIEEGRFGGGNWLQPDGPVLVAAFKEIPEGEVIESFLIGTSLRNLRGERKEEEVEPTANTASRASTYSSFGFSSFPEDQRLAHALQAAYLGYQPYAKVMLQKSAAYPIVGLGLSPLGEPRDESTECGLAFLALNHQVNRLVEPNSDRGEILRKLREIKDSGLVKDPNGLLQRFLLNLEKTCQPSKSGRSAVGVAIDSLTEMTSWDGSDPRYEAALKLGLKAVPELIDHMDDERLTRVMLPQIDNSPPRVGHLGLVCRRLIAAITHDVITDSYMPLTKIRARDWFRALKDGNLEDRLAAEAWPAPRARLDAKEYTAILALLGGYPRRFERVFLKFLKHRPDVELGPIIDGISRSSLPPEKQSRLLEITALRGQPDQAYSALENLCGVDQPVFEKIVLQRLRLIRPKVSKLGVDSAEIEILHLVRDCQDQTTWDEVQDLLSISRPELQVAILEALTAQLYGDPDNANAPRALRILSSHFDDKTRFKGHSLVRLQNGSALFTEYPWLSAGEASMLLAQRIVDVQHASDQLRMGPKLDILFEKIRKKVNARLARQP
jgi:hypothetical protein